MTSERLRPFCPQQRFDPFDLLGCLVRQEVEADPAIAVFGYSPQCRIALAAEPHRHAIVADWLWVAQHIRKLDELALMRAVALGLELPHDLDLLARTLAVALEGDTQSLELLRQPSDTDAKNEPTAA